MSVGSVQASNGSFYVTNNGVQQQVDLGTLMMMLNLDRTQNLDQQIAVQVSEIQDRNNQIKELTEFLSQCRKRKADGLDDGAPDNKTVVNADGTTKVVNGNSRGSLTINGETRSLQGEGSWAEKFGMEWSDVYADRPDDKDDAATWDANWDANIQNLKSKIDTLNNDSQMDNIKLQNLLEKRGNAFEMATKVMDTDNQSKQSIIRNL